jgi:dephospho-CoA kinase
MSLIIGVTGGIGSGKTAVTQFFSESNIDIIDADIVARKVVEPNRTVWKKIVHYFGPHVLLESKEINRAWLREAVFKDKKARQWLESITHPKIRQEIKALLNASTSQYSILVSPLLFETNQHLLVDKKVVVDVTETMQLERVSQRDDNTQEQIQRIINAQMTRQDRLDRADYIIDNKQDLISLKNNVETLHQYFLSICHE